MACVATVSADSFDGKLFKKTDYSYYDISGVEIMDIRLKEAKYKNKLLKILEKNKIKYVVSRDFPDISNIDGNNLVKSIYPIVLKRFVKMYRGYDSVVICADRLDSVAREAIFMMCDHFKYISVVTSDYNKDKFFDDVFLEKGVSILPFSESQKQPVLYLSGKMADGKNVFSIDEGDGIRIYTPDKRVLTPALCEAVIKAKFSEKCDIKAEFLRLKYKVI